MYLLVELSKSLADLAGLLAVCSHPRDEGVPAVAPAGPAWAAPVAVLARGAAVVPTAEVAGLLAVRLHPGVPLAAAVAVAGPVTAINIFVLAITCIYTTDLSPSSNHTKVHNSIAFTFM